VSRFLLLRNSSSEFVSSRVVVNVSDDRWNTGFSCSRIRKISPRVNVRSFGCDDVKEIELYESVVGVGIVDDDV
jgi:hypothetical protein